ncbi:MAG: type II toxin-antitoxin system PemK/MazF family toxin [Devosia sp.]
MKRGDIVTTAQRGDYGKPRPALVVQSDTFDETDSVTLLLITSQLQDAPLIRIDITPSNSNGLRKPSQVQIDKLTSAPRDRVGPVIGGVDSQFMLKINRQLAAFLAIVP